MYTNIFSGVCKKFRCLIKAMENEGFAQSDVEAVGERMQELTLVRLYLIRLVAHIKKIFLDSHHCPTTF